MIAIPHDLEQPFLEMAKCEHHNPLVSYWLN